jgi:hypothetical protein
LPSEKEDFALFPFKALSPDPSPKGERGEICNEFYLVSDFCGSKSGTVLEQGSLGKLSEEILSESSFSEYEDITRKFPCFHGYLRKSPNHEVEALFSSKSSEEYEVHRRMIYFL